MKKIIACAVAMAAISSSAFAGTEAIQKATGALSSDAVTLTALAIGGTAILVSNPSNGTTGSTGGTR